MHPFRPSARENSVCPECGSQPAAVTPPGWIARHRRLIQVLAVVLGIAGWIALNWYRWPAPPAPFAYGPGVTSHQFLFERFTAADLGPYARGERADGRLLDAFSLPDVSEHVSLEVAFTAPAGSVTQFQRYGWPTNWLIYRWDGQYADVYTRDHATSRPPWRPLRWSGLSHYSATVEPDGRRRVRIIALRAIVGPLVMLFAGWRLGRMIAPLLMRNPGRRRSARRVGSLAGLGLAAACLVALSLWPPVKVSHIWLTGGVGTVAPLTFATGLTTGNVLELRNEPGGEARLASIILQHSGAPHSANPDGVLLIGLGVSEPMRQSALFTGWPPGLLTMSHVEPVAVTTPSRLELRRVSVAEGGIGLWLADAAGRGVRRSIVISLVAVFEVVALLIVLWYVAGLCSLGVRGWRRRRERRRLAQGLCTTCGYETGTPN